PPAEDSRPEHAAPAINAAIRMIEGRIMPASKPLCIPRGADAPRACGWALTADGLFAIERRDLAQSQRRGGVSRRSLATALVLEHREIGPIDGGVDFFG